MLHAIVPGNYPQLFLHTKLDLVFLCEDVPTLSTDYLVMKINFTQAPLLAQAGAERMSQPGVVYMLSKPTIRARTGSSFLRRFILETLYTFLIRNSRPPTAKWQIPPEDILEIDVVHKA